MAKKNWTHFEYDHDNDVIRVFNDKEEIFLLELDELVEDYLESIGYKQK